jgi:hypothetical protein
MGQRRFVNQKLGKNVSRKFDLLKSELAAHAKRRAQSRPLNVSNAKKAIAPGKS